MLTRANLIGKVQSADTKLLPPVAIRRLLPFENHSNRHGSDTSKTLAEMRRRCSDGNTGEQLSLCCDRGPHLSKPYSKVLDSRMPQWKHRSGIRLTDDQMRVVDPRGGELYSSTHYADRGTASHHALDSRSAKNISFNRLQTVEGQRTKDLNLIEEVEACFSNSLSLVPQHVEEAHAQHENSLRGSGRSANPPATHLPGSIVRRAEGGRTETALAKIWKRKKGERRIRGLLLLNGLAAVYGSSNVANKYMAEAAPALPVSLTSLVKFTSALIFFVPSLVSALKNRETDLLRAGAELGALAFAATFVDSCNPAASLSSIPSLLFAFTVVFVPLMELLAGRQSGPKFTRLATLSAAILGMGVLEEEGFGWKGISCPHISDLWGVAVSVISALHIFRSEAHGQKFDPIRLNAVQCGVLAILSLGWEMWRTFNASSLLQGHVFDMSSLQSIPWVPLLYNGLVCSGLSSLLELRGLRSVHASTATLVYTTIPVWGALLSSFVSHDVPTDSAIIVGLVIAATSIYAQYISKDEDLRVESASSTAPATVESNAASITSSTEKAGASKGDGYFPAGLLVSQLKFPYYAAQAKGLLVEIKFKLGALKSLGLVLTGISSNSILPTSPSSALTSGSVATSTSTTNSGANNLTTSHIGTASSQAIDVSNASTVHVPHEMHVATTNAISAAHVHGFSNVFSHLSTSFTSGLESVLVAVSVDLTMAVDEAEGAATILERLVHGGAESALDLVAAAYVTAGGSLGVLNTNLTGSDTALQATPNFVETASQLDGAVEIQPDLLTNTYHVTDVVINGFSHFSDLILPFINNATM